MNQHVENSIVSVCISAPFVVLLYFIGSWFLQANENISLRELAKHETCYQEFRLDERTGETYLTIDYCGDQ